MDGETTYSKSVGFFPHLHVWLCTYVCVCVAAVSAFLVLAHCPLERRLIRNSRRALLTIPSEYAEDDRHGREMESEEKE